VVICPLLGGEVEKIMCYNCGCEMPDEDHGFPANITDKSFEDAAKVTGQSAEEAKENTMKLLNKLKEEKE